MKIKMTNNNATEILYILNKFSDCTGKVGLYLSKTKRRIINEIKDYEDIREKLIRKYGEENKDGNLEIKPGTDNYQKFLDEIIPLSKEVIEVEIFQVTQEDFDKFDYYNDNISTKEYDLIQTMFVKQEDDKVDKNNGDE